MNQLIFIDRPDEVNFGIQRGADCTIQLTLCEGVEGVPAEDSPVINLTGWQWQCQFFDIDGGAKTPFTVVSVNPTLGRIDLRLTRAQTADVAAFPERMTWRLFGEDSVAYKRKHLFGTIVMQD